MVSSPSVILQQIIFVANQIVNEREDSDKYDD